MTKDKALKELHTYIHSGCTVLVTYKDKEFQITDFTGSPYANKFKTYAIPRKVGNSVLWLCMPSHSDSEVKRILTQMEAL
jgi:hypothetical protein